MRLFLARRSPSRVQLVWTYHHLVLDGWSVALVLKEVVELYEAYLAGAPLTLPEPLPYSEYIAWLEAQNREVAEAFWRRTLRGFDTPTDPNIESDRSGQLQEIDVSTSQRHTTELPPQTTQRLQQLARECRLTMSTILQGAWAIVLRWYSDRRDVVFGVTSAGRPADIRGIERAVGVFINTLPVRVQVLDGQSVIDLLRLLQAEQLEARRYDYSALVQIQGWSDVRRGRLFDTIVVVENFPISHLPPPASGSNRFDLVGPVETIERNNYSLTALAIPGDTWSLSLTSSGRIYDRGALDRMLGHWRRILEAVADDPTQMARALNMLGAAERAQVLDEANRHQPEAAMTSLTLPELFDAVATNSPNSIAVTDGNRHISYGLLRQRADCLARQLRDRGVGRNAIVAVAMERSAEMVVALIGILKAGAAYLPLDPDYPTHRVSFMLDDASPLCGVTSAELIARMPSTLSWICLEEQEGALEDRDKQSDAASHGATGMSPHSAAYVIYTSGSTGTPKGVVVTHQNVIRLFEATAKWFEFSSDDVWTLFHSYAFDVSVWEMWGALLHGGRLVIVPRGTTRSPYELLDLLEREQVTVLNQTPGAFYQILDADARSGTDARRLALRYVVFAGEALDFRRLRPWYARYPAPTLINMYGITETTVHASFYRLDVSDCSQPTSVIGESIPDLRIYILNRDLQPMPLGAVGELYVSGPGLAQGYLHRPALTASRFIPDPFSVPGSRMYRSGDRGRRCVDGTMEYLGRSDRQVKIRGFRVELHEVEAAVAASPGIRDSVVVVRTAAQDDVRLIAYYVPASNTTVTHRALRQHVAGRIPDYMVPSAFVAVDRIPLTINGKVDRDALPLPTTAANVDDNAFVADDLERMVTETWRAALQTDRVGPNDNFFDLGGHSVLLMRVYSDLRQQVACQLSVTDLFKYPTVSSLAEYIRQNSVLPTGASNIAAVSQRLRH
jgi:amino acid adenylation domain-containing protein